MDYRHTQSNTSFRTSIFSTQGENIMKQLRHNTELDDTKVQARHPQYGTNPNSKHTTKRSQWNSNQKPVNERQDSMIYSQYVGEKKGFIQGSPLRKERTTLQEVPIAKAGSNVSLLSGSQNYLYQPLAQPLKPFNKFQTEYDTKRKGSEYQHSGYSLDPAQKPKPQMFSYFFHDMEQEEAEAVLPNKQEKTICSNHGEPVVMYSYPYGEFICQQCYEMLRDKADCYALSDLQKPMERQYAGLMQYIEGGRTPKLDRYLQDYKSYLEQVKHERYRYLTEYEKALIDRELLQILYDLQMFWKKIEEMQLQYKSLRRLNDFETILLMHKRWSSICFDFKEKYLNFEFFKNLVDRRIDPIMRPIANKVGLCFMCMSNDAKLSCNNLKDDSCSTCKECANYCPAHGYYCRYHQDYVGERSADKQYLGTSCPLCKYSQMSQSVNYSQQVI